VHDLLVGLAVACGVCCALFAASVLWIRWRLQRMVRVRPGTPSPAPVGWVMSTSEPARLHRRLRRSAASARLAATYGGPAVASLAAEVEEEAVRLEVSLVALSRVWRNERQLRKELAGQIIELEHLAARVAASSDLARHRAGLTGGTDHLTELRERIDAVDAARQELLRLERRTGLAG